MLNHLKNYLKDEVRILGRNLKINPDLLNRHPFPRMSLAIRIPGEIDKDKIDILQRVDNIYKVFKKEFALY